MYPVTLAGRVVTLREFRTDDVAGAFSLVGNDRVTQYLSFDSRTYEQTEAMVRGITERAILTPREEYYLAVVGGSDDLIGFARLGLGGVSAAKLGYAVRPDRWNKGTATDAARTIVKFGFECLDLHRVTAAIGPQSAASIRVAEKIGMQYEGRLRDHVFTNGSWRDSLLYSLIVTDWTNDR